MAVTFQPSFQPKVRFEWINESWQLVVANLGVWIGALLIAGIIASIVSYGCMFAFGVFPYVFSHTINTGVPPITPYAIYFMPGYWASIAISSIASAYFATGLFRMALAQLRGQPIELGMLFRFSPTFLPYVGYQIVAGFAIAVGTALFILPGLAMIALFAPGYAMIADGVSFNEALSRSTNTVGKDWFQASILVLVFGLIYLVSAIPCGLGIFVTLPMAMFISCLMYRDMIGMPGGLTNAQQMPGYFEPSAPGVWPPAPGTQPPPSNPYAPTSPTAYPPPAPTYPQAQHGNIDQWTPPVTPSADPPSIESEDDLGTSPTDRPV